MALTHPRPAAAQFPNTQPETSHVEGTLHRDFWNEYIGGRKMQERELVGGLRPKERRQLRRLDHQWQPGHQRDKLRNNLVEREERT